MRLNELLNNIKYIEETEENFNEPEVIPVPEEVNEKLQYTM